jgi:pyruvate dehydrogenase E1 component alpha subunit
MPIDQSNYIIAYKKIFLIRQVQIRLQELYLEKKIFSMVHFSTGQEAVAVGVCSALTVEDKVMGSHRSQALYLAKGGDVRKLVCEALGKGNGISKGKGGVMHLIDKANNFVGSSPLLGSSVPIASGVAYALKISENKNIAAVFYGDGASEEGVVYETYNLASTYALPILFIIENNLHSINSQLSDRRSNFYDTSLITRGLGISKYTKVDGNNFHEVFNVAKQSVKYIREECKPAIIECITYRHLAHSTPLMEEKYRTIDDLTGREKADCVKELRRLVISNDVIPESKLIEIELEIQNSVSEDILYSLNSEYPAKKELYNDLYFE